MKKKPSISSSGNILICINRDSTVIVFVFLIFRVEFLFNVATGSDYKSINTFCK